VKTLLFAIARIPSKMFQPPAKTNRRVMATLVYTHGRD